MAGFMNGRDTARGMISRPGRPENRGKRNGRKNNKDPVVPLTGPPGLPYWEEMMEEEIFEPLGIVGRYRE